jgi:hypothetical protein
MRLYVKLEYLWGLLRAMAARVNRPLVEAEDDEMVFQIPSWEKTLLEKSRPSDGRAK